MRESNMELLRIVSMLLVMALHANFRALPLPGVPQIAANPSSAWLQFLVEGFAIVAVNVFVLISGWYGIRPRLSRLGGLVFQVLFFLLLSVACCAVVAPDDLDSKMWGRFFLLGIWDYWFVKAYLALYILSPVLNAFVEKASRRQFGAVLAGFFALELVYGWWAPDTGWWAKGFSFPSFIGLYLLARFMRLHPLGFWKKNRWLDLGIYVLMGLSLTVIMFVLKSTGRPGAKWYFYTCPLVIVGAMHLLLFFSKIHFSSKAVNWVAASAFAAYLTQSNWFFGKYYDEFIRQWFNNEPRFTFIIYTVAFVVAVFVVSILLDKFRLLLWQGLLAGYRRVKTQNDEKDNACVRDSSRSD